MIALAISGSLRAASINSALLRAAARLWVPAVELRLCRTIAELPLFNPDLEASLPAPVAAFHAEVAAAEALVIASPEYAHGVSGTIKNALDWLVSFEPFVGKPVAVWNASPRAHHADAALKETLRTMSARIVVPACASIPLLGAHLREDDMVENPEVSRVVRQALQALHDDVVAPEPQTPRDAFLDTSLTIRPITPQDFEAWKPLWDGYNAFYGRSGPTALPEEVTRTTWSRFFDGYEPVNALVAESAGRLLGLAHYLFHRSTTQIAPSCYLQDLFTVDEARGKGVGRALIEAVRTQAMLGGAGRLYWQTHETNTVAMRLYDKVAEKSGFVVYRKAL